MTNLLSRWIARAARARAPRSKSHLNQGLVAWGQPRRARWTASDYQSLVSASYVRNPIAHRAVRLVADAAASLPWLLYDGAHELDQHPLLALLRRPNPRQSGSAFFEALYSYVLIAGNAYVECVSVEEGPRELHLLRPDRVKILSDATGWPEAYDYAVRGTVRRYPAGEGAILHLAQFHPLDDHYGLGALEAAAHAVDIHNGGSDWNKALLDNAAKPSGALVYKGPEGHANLTDEQYERLKSELETNYQGADNAGRPLLLEGGLSWTAMSLSPQDMEFIEARHIAAREVALAFGVPPMLLGIPGDNTYANYREANLALWRQTVVPLVGKVAQALEAFLAPHYPEALTLSFDLDAVPALATEREALWARVNEATFLSDDEKRAALGYGARDGRAAP